MRQRRQRLERLALLRGPRQGHARAARTSTTTRKKRLRILSLTDNTPYILAWGNDEGFDRVFVEQLKNLASPGDLLDRHQRLGQQPEHPAGRRVGQPPRPDDVRLHRLLRRQAADAGPAGPARAARRHGHRRVDPPDGVPLGRGRPAPADRADLIAGSVRERNEKAPDVRCPFAFRTDEPTRRSGRRPAAEGAAAEQPEDADSGEHCTRRCAGRVALAVVRSSPRTGRSKCSV